MKRKAWMRPLRKSINSIIEQDIWEYNPDAPHPRIEGEFGREVKVFNKIFNDLVICIDTSEPINFDEDYGEVINYIDRCCQGVPNRFYRTHLNLWADNFYINRLSCLHKYGLLDKVEKYYDEVKNEVSTGESLASAIVNPFDKEQPLSKVKPDMMLVFTRGKIINDLSDSLKLKIRRFRKALIWIYMAGHEEADLSAIKDIDPKAEKRTIIVTSESIQK